MLSLVLLFSTTFHSFIFFFFFSSRRRHTRSLCDWSSDVCSSDLLLPQAREPPDDGVVQGARGGQSPRPALARRAPPRRGDRERGQPWPRGGLSCRASRHPGHDRQDRKSVV